jgi:hypothetical protein
MSKRTALRIAIDTRDAKRAKTNEYLEIVDKIREKIAALKTELDTVSDCYYEACSSAHAADRIVNIETKYEEARKHMPSTAVFWDRVDQGLAGIVLDEQKWPHTLCFGCQLIPPTKIYYSFGTQGGYTSGVILYYATLSVLPPNCDDSDSKIEKKRDANRDLRHYFGTTYWHPSSCVPNRDGRDLLNILVGNALAQVIIDYIVLF